MTFKQFLWIAAILFITIVLSSCNTMLHPIPTAIDAERIQLQVDLNEQLYDLRQHKEYLESEDYSFVIQRYNNHVVYAGSLDKETNKPIEEIIFFKGKWYHISQNDRIREVISSESAIEFIRWIYVETNNS